MPGAPVRPIEPSLPLITTDAPSLPLTPILPSTPLAPSLPTAISSDRANSTFAPLVSLVCLTVKFLPAIISTEFVLAIVLAAVSWPVAVAPPLAVSAEDLISQVDVVPAAGATFKSNVVTPLVVVDFTCTELSFEVTLYDLFNFAFASSVKSTLISEPLAVVLMYWLAPLAPEPSPLMLNLIPPLLSKASLVVSVLPSAPRLILLLNLSFTIFNCSSVAARPLVAKSLPAVVGIVVLVKPVISPVLPFRLIL